jgi:hypothetical protein
VSPCPRCGFTSAADHRRTRDRTLRELARSLPQATTNAKAAAIAGLAATYAGNGWLRDRNKAICPGELKDKPEAFLWRCFKLQCRFPLSADHIARIIK